MIHAALWVASFLFLACLAFVVIVFAWRFILGGLALVLIAGLALFTWRWVENREAEQRAAQAPPAQVVPAPTVPEASTVEALQASVATARSAQAQDKEPPIPEFANPQDRLAYLRWLAEMSGRLAVEIPDGPTRKSFLQALWYESRRAGLDVSLTMGMVDYLSNFRKFRVSDSDARGYFAVNPRWVSIIGDGDPSKLFHMQTNMRFGCVIFRHLLDQDSGDLRLALGRYLADSNRLPPMDPRIERQVDLVFAAQRRWVFKDPAATGQAR